MKIWRWIIIGVLIAGALSGPSALEQGAAAQPPIAWPDIPFVFFGSVFGMLFVIGIQLFRSDSKPSLWALYFFAPASLWLATSGLSAAILAIARGSASPSAFLFFSTGAGALLGVWACWLIFRRRFKNAL